MKTNLSLLLITLLTIPGLTLAKECNYANAFAVALNVIASKVPDMEKHAPYQVIEHNDHWTGTGYSGLAAVVDIAPTATIDKTSCSISDFHFTELTQNLSN